LRPVFLVAFGGSLYCLGYVGFGIWPLALICLVPLWVALEELRSRRLGRAGLLGFAFAWVAHAGGFRWLWRLVEVFLGGNAAHGAALWLVHSLWFALGFALYAVVYHRLRQKNLPVALAALPPLLVLEWRYPSLFPVHLGDTLVDQTALIQIVDLGGPLLASVLVALVNLAVFESWRWWRGERPRLLSTWICVGLAVFGAAGYGMARIGGISRSLADAPALRVGLVQGNLGVLEKRREAALVHRRYLEQTRELLAAAELDLVVWPETVYIRGLKGPFPISGEAIREELRAPLLFGAATVRTVEGRRRIFNSALLIGADGVIQAGYDKNLPVPFAEEVPLAGRFPAFAALLPHAQEFGAGSGTPPLSLGPWRISTPICSESAEPWFVRRMLEQADPHLIVSLANDAWFGDSQEPWIHLAVARLRAAEHKRFLVHATNSGVSAVVDPFGRVVARSGLLTRESLTATVRLRDEQTPYARLGDWPGWLGLAITLAALAWRRVPAVGL
jgi:apolipoprotein N-acyltransferase